MYYFFLYLGIDSKDCTIKTYLSHDHFPEPIYKLQGVAQNGQVLQATLVGFVHLSVVLNLPFVVNNLARSICYIPHRPLIIFLCRHSHIFI